MSHFATCRIVGKPRDGGLQVDSGPGGFTERTLFLIDLAWVNHAAEDATATGELLDESRINELRYQGGMPKESTMVDTGWVTGARAWHALALRSLS